MTTYYKALIVNGVDNRVNFGDDASVRTSAHMSAVGVFGCGAQGAGKLIMGRDDLVAVNGRSWFVGTSPLGARRLRVGCTTNGIWSNPTARYWDTMAEVLPVSGNAHIAFTIGADVADMKLYVDAGEIAAWVFNTGVGVGAPHDGPAALMCGGRVTGGFEWKNVIKEVSFWKNSVLTQADITSLNGGKNPNDLVPSGGAVLVSSWIRNSKMPDIPGSGNVPDNTGTNPGTLMGTMTPANVVDTTKEYPWDGGIVNAGAIGTMNGTGLSSVGTVNNLGRTL
jgi:hypothetical protein